MFSKSRRVNAIFGIGSKQNERHRESRTSRLLDGMKIGALTITTAVVSASLFSLYRRWQAYINPSSSTLALHQRVDTLLSERRDLAAALVTMTMFHMISLQAAPLGAPMVAPSHLRKEAATLSDLVCDLQMSLPNTTTPDLWDLLICKSFAVLGGPSLKPLEGRREGVSTELVVFPVGPDTSTRNIKSLRSRLESRGYTANEVVAMVGMYRGIGVDSSRQCTTNPHRIDKEYFENLTSFVWGQMDGEWYQCTSKDQPSERFVRMQKKRVGVSPEPAVPKNTNAAPINRCDTISMSGMDMSLLDDPMTEGWLTRFAENEVLFLSAIGDLVQKQRINSLRRLSVAQ